MQLRSMCSTARGKRAVLVLFILLVFLVLAGERTVGAEEKPTIGLVEQVILLPWGVKLPARIDTGAARSSLDAEDMEIKDNTVRFHLAKKFGGAEFLLPIAGWQTFRSSEARERRPIVEIELCLGPRRLRVWVNLNDRSHVKYPFLIGRDVLKRNFLVDPMKFINSVPPTCPGIPGK